MFLGDSRRIERVRTFNGIEEHFRIATVFANGPIWSSEDPSAISAVARNCAIRRLQADETRMGGGLANGTAGIGTERSERHVAATPQPSRLKSRPARAWVMRILAPAEGRVLGREPMANSSMFVRPGTARPLLSISV
jgi:hypothetical protein